MLAIIISEPPAKKPEKLTGNNESVSLTDNATLTCKIHVGKWYKGESTFLWLLNGSLIQNSSKYTTVQKL
jgi:hypothetical protein